MTTSIGNGAERAARRSSTVAARKVKVAVVYRQPIVRAALDAVVASQSDMEVVADATDDGDLGSVYAARAEVVLLELDVQETMAGIASIAALRAIVPAARVVVMSDCGAADEVRRVIAAGACGYVFKGDEIAEVLAAIRAVSSGRSYATASVAARLDEQLPALLTARERRVLELLLEGATNRAIGALLGTSEETVKGHVRNILSKLDARSRTEAVAKALRLRVIRLD